MSISRSARHNSYTEMSGNQDRAVVGRSNSYFAQKHGQAWHEFWDSLKGPPLRRFNPERRRCYKSHVSSVENDLMDLPDNQRHVVVMPITTSSTAFGPEPDAHRLSEAKAGTKTTRAIHKLTSALSSAFSKGGRHQNSQKPPQNHGVMYDVTEQYTQVRSFC